MQDSNDNLIPQEEVDPMHSELLVSFIDKSNEIIERLTRIEEGQSTLMKHVVTGNGVPSLLKRVDTLEAENDEHKGSSRVKKAVTGFVLALILASAGWSVTLWVNFHKDEQAVQKTLMDTDKRLENKIDGVQQELKQHEQQVAGKGGK
jgi:hypothetical protein